MYFRHKNLQQEGLERLVGGGGTPVVISRISGFEVKFDLLDVVCLSSQADLTMF